MVNSVGSTSHVYLPGLASGMDTEAMIDSLTASQQAKVDKCEQEIKLLELKQEQYQEVITELENFQNKYFDSNGELKSEYSDFMTAVSDSGLVDVSVGDDVTISKIVISDIDSLASAAKYLGASGTLSDPITFTLTPEQLTALPGKSFNITIDGQEETITFDADAYSSVDEVASELQQDLDDAFGDDKVEVVSDGTTISFTAGTAATAGASNVVKITDPITGARVSNRVDLGAPMSSFEELAPLFPYDTSSGTPVPITDADGNGVADVSFVINGATITINENENMLDVMNSVNSSDAGVTMTYSEITDSFTLTSNDTGSSYGIEIGPVANDPNTTVDESASSAAFTNALFGTATNTPGTDCVLTVEIDGGAPTTIVRSSNSFTIDGVSISIDGIPPYDDVTGTTEDITITVDYDSQKIFDTVMSIVNDYNAMITYLNDVLNEEEGADEYPPLTDAQRAEMTESEQELWDEQTESGLIYHDKIVTDIANDMKDAMLTPVEKAGDSEDSIESSLYEIGISTGGYENRGVLTVDEDKLMQAINDDPEAVLDLLFQQPDISSSAYLTPEQQQERYEESGLFVRIYDIIEAATRTMSGVEGSLVSLAGAPGGINPDNAYSMDIAEAEKQMKKEQETLEKMEQYYYARFTAMENYIAMWNSQSAALYGQMPTW